jgi:hypothetical protein
MSSQKVTFIVLVVIAILFVVGQGGGLFRDDKSDKDPDQKRQQEISQEQSGWTGAIQGGLGWLNLLDKLEERRISAWSASPSGDASCTGQRVDGRTILTMGAECKLSTSIAKADDEQELKLKVIEGCGESREFARLNRISTVVVEAKPHIVPGRITARPSGEALSESADKRWPKLWVSFKPTGENEVTMDDPWVCGDKPVTLIIMPQGGTLTLDCGSCTDEKKLKIEID